MDAVSAGLYSSKNCYYDEDSARRVVFFIEEYCRHVKGPLAGHNLILARWQKKLICNLFGWRRKHDSERRYRQLWLEAPCKSGKSTLAASLALYMLLVDPEPNAEIAIVSTDKKQAFICFNIAKQMIENDPDLSSLCRVYKNIISYKDAHIRVLSSRCEHGENISCLIFDELHHQSSRQLHDSLITSTAARAEPLVLYLTTAGMDRSSLAWDLHQYAEKARDNIIDDPSWLVSIFAAEASADWTSRRVWQSAHPGLGITVSEEFLHQECLRAQQTPGYISSFRRLYLNTWTDKASAWLDMRRWDDCGEQPIALADLIGRSCYAGLDLSSTTDLTALVLVFTDPDGGYTVLPYAFCPYETVVDRTLKDNVPYVSWKDQGLLTATPGNTIDHNAVIEKIAELSRLFDIHEIAFDRWNSSMLINELTREGFTCVPVPQTAGAMNPPARELERIVAEGGLRHGNHAVLRWCASNTSVEMNANGEVRPTRSKSREKIDLIVALLMAMSRHLVRM